MNIWIINHYAMPPEYEMRVRNNKMAKFLKEQGHCVKIISASTLHNTDIDLLEGSLDKIKEKSYEGLDFVHVKTSKYQGNGLGRIKNHLQFPWRLWRNYKKISQKPDVIVCDLGALFAVIPYYISKKLKAKFVLEVRDLWPESIVEFLGYSRKNPLIKLLYAVEKWIYKRSDRLVFSMAGGKQYLLDNGLDKKVDLNKVFHITNGVDLEEFTENIRKFEYIEASFSKSSFFKVVYTGSIRTANNVEFLIDVAEKLKELQAHHIKLYIFGDGPDREAFIKRIEDLGLENIAFMGQVHKSYIPNILSKSDLTILHYKQTKTWKYGGSQNKLSEYIACQKPILSTIDMNYNPITTFACGEVCATQNPKVFAEKILWFSNLEEKTYRGFCENAQNAAQNLDYKSLTQTFEQMLQECLKQS